MSETDSVVVTGKAIEGFSEQQMKAGVGKLFKLSAEQLEKVFSGKPVALRRGIEKEQALKICAALTKVGAVAAVKVSRPPAAKTQAIEPAKVKPTAVANVGPDICCPRCGHEQPFVTACGLCKMDLALHIQRLKRKQQAREFRQKSSIA